jgi:hypothetical protein
MFHEINKPKFIPLPPSYYQYAKAQAGALARIKRNQLTKCQKCDLYGCICQKNLTNFPIKKFPSMDYNKEINILLRG